MVIAEGGIEKRTILTEFESEELVRKFEIPVAKSRLTKSIDDCHEALKEIGLPAVAKLIATGFTHKSEANLVKLNLKSESEVVAAWEELHSIATSFPKDMEIQGILLQEMLEGLELVVGVKRDPVFGPVVTVGLGGIFVELIGDYSVRTPPISVEEALRMMDELKNARVLHGVRGKQAVDRMELANVIVKVSEMVLRINALAEMDLNPVISGKAGTKVADARIILSDEEGEQKKPDEIERADPKKSIRALIYPKSIAVIGASADRNNFPNGIIVPNLQKFGFEGKVFPVNVKQVPVCGLTCYASVKDIGRPVDVAYIAVPASRIAAVLADCVNSAVKVAIAISADLSNDDVAAIRRVCSSSSLRFCGANCEGIISTTKRVNLTFVELDRGIDGDICFLSHSGGIAVRFAQVLWQKNVGVAYSISLGNCIDLDFSDFLKFCLKDDKVRVIGIYLEGVKNGQTFVAAALALTRAGKPIVLFKPRHSPTLNAQIQSHTGALVGSDRVFDAVCRQNGIIRVQSINDLFNTLMALSWQPCPRGRRVGVVGDTGGYAIIFTDVLERLELKLAEFTSGTKRKLGNIIGNTPVSIPLLNPLDTDSAVPEPRIPILAKAVAEDENVDVIVVIMIGPFTKSVADSVRQTVYEINTELGKPVYFVFTGSDIVGSISKEIAESIREHHIPVYAEPEEAASVIKGTTTYGEFLNTRLRTNTHLPEDSKSYNDQVFC